LIQQEQSKIESGCRFNATLFVFFAENQHKRRLTMSQFMLFIRAGEESTEDLSPEQIQQAIQRYSAWAKKLREQGKLVAAEKLKDNTGLLFSARDGRIVVDGPFAETKETIGGYFVYEAASEAEAIAIARECPALGNGGVVELREIEP
jgi:hypothetical protein